MRFYLFIFIFILGCGVSDESFEQDWRTFVAENNSCENADQCVAVFPGCPMGCWTAVSKSAEQAAKSEAAELVSSYENGGESCLYDCDVAPALVCESEKCAFQK